jgi:hypothetical protein
MVWSLALAVVHRAVRHRRPIDRFAILREVMHSLLHNNQLPYLISLELP